MREVAMLDSWMNCSFESVLFSKCHATGLGCVSQSQQWSQVPSLPIQLNGTCEHSWLTMLLGNALLNDSFTYWNDPTLKLSLTQWFKAILCLQKSRNAKISTILLCSTEEHSKGFIKCNKQNLMGVVFCFQGWKWVYWWAGAGCSPEGPLWEEQ